MNMFERMFRVVTSNVNSVIKGLEDPEKVIEQAVIDMQNDLVKVRQSYAEVSATQKRMEKQNDQAVSGASDWYRRAQLALDKGDEELAREALARRQTQIDISENLQKQMKIQESAINKLYTSMTALESKINDAKRQKEALIARARTAKTSVQVNDMLSGLNSMTGSSSMDSFERMRTKVETLESQAEIAGELAANNAGTSVNLEERFKELEGSSSIDKELEMMKRQLPGSKKQIEQLPSSIDRDYERLKQSSLDIEYERMKRELRK